MQGKNSYKFYRTQAKNNPSAIVTTPVLLLIFGKLIYIQWFCLFVDFAAPGLWVLVPHKESSLDSAVRVLGTNRRTTRVSYTMFLNVANIIKHKIKVASPQILFSPLPRGNHFQLFKQFSLLPHIFLTFILFYFPHCTACGILVPHQD